MQSGGSASPPCWQHARKRFVRDTIHGNYHIDSMAMLCTAAPRKHQAGKGCAGEFNLQPLTIARPPESTARRKGRSQGATE